MDSGVTLPKWHCCFKGCRICSDDVRDRRNHEVGLWGHTWRKDIHKPALLSAIQIFRLTEGEMNEEEIAFALFNSALVYSERQLCPLVGVSTDRRCLHNLSEVFTENNIKTLVCFICRCKHVCCEGFNMFGARS